MTLAFALLAAFTSVAFALASRASEDAGRITEERHALSAALYELNTASDAKVRLVRFVSVTGGTPQPDSHYSLHYANYRTLIERDWVQQSITTFLYHNAPQQEIDLLEEFARRRGLLNEISEEVFRLRHAGYFEDAINLAHSPEFSYISLPLGPKVEELLSLIYDRTSVELEIAEGTSDTFMLLSMVFAITLIMVGVMGAMILFSVGSPKWVRIGVCFFVVVSVANLVFLTRAIEFSVEMQDIRKEQHALISAVYDLERGTETLTRMSRAFAITFDMVQFQTYQLEMERGLFGQSLDTFILLQAPPQETNAMVDLVNRVTTLRHLETRVMQERIEGLDRNVAIEQVFGETFASFGSPINPLCDELRYAVRNRTSEAFEVVRANYVYAHNLVLSSTTFLLLVGTIGTVIKVRRGIDRKEKVTPIFVTKIRNANIKTSLYIAFTAIIVVFGGQILANTFLNNNIRNLHNHNLEFTMRRSEVLLEFHRELTEMQLVLTESFLNPTWIETADSGLWSSYEQRLTQTYINLNALAESYKASVANDPIFPELEYDTRVFIMSTIMNYVRTLYSNFENNFFIDGNRSFVHDYDISYDGYAIIILGVLHRLRELNQEIVTESIRHYTALTHNIAITSLIVATVIAVGMAWFVIHRFTTKMKNIQEDVEAVVYGDFDRISEMEDTDEISRLFKSVMEMLSNVVKQINHVITQHEEGDNEIRIDANYFQGSSLEMVLAVNKLLDTVNESLTAIRLAEERSHIMLNGSPSACFLIDEDFGIIDCNSAAIELLKFVDKEETLLRSHEVFAARGYGTLEKVFISALESGFESFDWELTDAYNNLIPTHITFARFLSRDKKVIAAYIQDMSVLRSMMEQQELIAIAQENSQAKSRFLARMSHELRTPLTAILGISEIQMHNKSLPVNVDEAFTKIHSSASGLLGIVNDILDLSKIEAGKMDIVSSEYDSASLFSDVAQLNLAYLGSKQLEFVVDVDENVPALMKGDELRIKQVMNNVLSNAFKYTEQGSVKLRVRVENADIEGVVNLVITVDDTGRGMSEEQLKTMFDDYIRFHTRHNYFEVGTGLGMSITQGLLSQMNGTIAVSSDVGKGTSVVIVLPQIMASAQILGKATSKSLRSFSASPASLSKRLEFKPEPMPYGKVLVVDDVDANIYVARGLLELYGLDIETCYCGKEAIQKIEAGKVYDIIFMDQMMPEITGMEATAIIREMAYTHPIVALTANALVGQADEFLKSGFDGFLSKPIQTAHLNAVLHKFIKDKYFPDTPPANVDDKQAEQFFNNHMMSSEVVDKINKDFLSTQKGVAKEITNAHEQGDAKTAERLAHTLKGLSALIDETNLSTVAAEIEACFRDGEDATDAISRLEAELNPVIERLSKQYPEDCVEEATQQWVKTLDKALAKDVFDRLEELLKRRSFDATDMLKELEEIPDTNELAIAVKGLDFRQALKTLADLRENLDI